MMVAKEWTVNLKSFEIYLCLACLSIYLIWTVNLKSFEINLLNLLIFALFLMNCKPEKFWNYEGVEDYYIDDKNEL